MRNFREIMLQKTLLRNDSEGDEGAASGKAVEAINHAGAIKMEPES
jgi:hypothetical protein